MRENLDAAITALRDPKTTDADRRLWQEIAKRGILYASDKQIIQLRYLMLPFSHESRKPA